MRETLHIRLGSQEQDPVYWLITAPGQTDEIASGVLATADNLTELTEKAETRDVNVLVNSADVRLKALTVPGKNDRAIRQATPYMLEEDLVEDVEDLFFAYATKPSEYQGDANTFVAIVAHKQIETWISWLHKADIKCKSMVPDVLALPHHENSWVCLNIDDQWLVRPDAWLGFVVDQDNVDLFLQQYVQNRDEDEADIHIQSFSQIDDFDSAALPSGVDIESMPQELPMKLLADYSSQSRFNLLQGPYQFKEERSPMVQMYLKVAAVAVVALLINMLVKGIEIYQNNGKYELYSEQIETEYKQAFGQNQKVRMSTVKRQISSKISELGGAGGDDNLLTMLEKLRPAFVKVPTMKPESMKYDDKRQELRISVVANNYQAFEQFKSELEKADMDVTTGAQNNQGDQVVGSFNIRSKS
ncbi:type II secretion system protein GspL [Thalassotalea sp. PS06]|uniref:type II secretion system protein GspL n=1 Tax=Thalassotalea sp. PS06 TaxID=2594005 RepID=UPI0011626537|nr:type II secretion system protein GspL [Thalassotalea sp. PS06]QDP00025.1 type II secretion system protein GspL [Thalassotalea sp. PS06]